MAPDDNNAHHSHDRRIFHKCHKTIKNGGGDKSCKSRLR